MAKSYKLKNPEKKGAKLPPEVHRSIVRMYCEGKTQADAAQALGVSRQTVNARYAEIGDKLFHLASIEEGLWSRKELMCDQCRDKHVAQCRELLYATTEQFQERRTSAREFWGAQLGRMLFRRSIQSEGLNELLSVSKKVKGIKHLYIQWARIHWLSKFREQHPGAADETLCNLLFEKCLTPFPITKKGTNCHRTDFGSVRYECYRDRQYPNFVFRLAYGRIDQFETDTPETLFMAQVVEEGELTIDNFFVLWRVYAGDMTKWFDRITDAEFERAVEDTRLLDQCRKDSAVDRKQTAIVEAEWKEMEVGVTDLNINLDGRSD